MGTGRAENISLGRINQLMVDTNMQIRYNDALNGYLYTDMYGFVKAMALVPGGTDSGWQGEVATYADLPAAAAHNGELYLVNTSTWLSFPPHLAGLYRSNGASWSKIKPYSDVFADNVAIWHDDANNTKKARFELSGITAGETRVITVPDSDVTLHVQNTDTSLDFGGLNQITASDIKSHTLAANIHRAINDAGTSETELWSASKINTALGGKEASDATILKQANVVDNLISTSTTTPLSANMGTTLDLYRKRLEGIYLDLPYLYNHNCKLIATCESDEGWADNRWSGAQAAAHGDDTTNFKTGSQGISITAATYNAFGLGINNDFTDMDLTVFPDGSVSSTSDYIEFSVYAPADYASIYISRLYFHNDVIGTETNYLYSNIHTLITGAGWNHIKIAKSAFIAVGSGAWASVKGMSIRLSATDGYGSIALTFDAIRMTRKDPSSAIPNPLQIEKNGVNERLFQVASGTVFLGYDGATLCLKAFTESVIKSVITYSDLYFKAIGKTSATALLNIGLDDTNDNTVAVTADTLALYSDGANASTAFEVSTGDEVTLRGQILGKSLNGYASKTGLTAFLNRTATAGLTDKYAIFTLYIDALLTSLKISSSRLMIGD